MDSEKDLIDAFEKVVHRDFSNPERVGCPGNDVLERFATHPADPGFAGLLAHIRQCAPCFDKVKGFRRSAVP